jgi:hypothetical protein
MNPQEHQGEREEMVRQFGFFQYQRWEAVEPFVFDVYIAGFPRARKWFTPKVEGNPWSWDTEVWMLVERPDLCAVDVVDIGRRLTDGNLVRCYVKRRKS